MDVEVLWVQMQVGVGIVVSAQTAPISLAQKVTADLCSGGDIGDIRVKGGEQVV